MLEFGLKLLTSYLLGSISGSLVIGRLAGGVDIRRLGSGNAGATNALRTQGPLFALAVVIIDVGKGVLATAVVANLAIPGVADELSLGAPWLAAGCGAAAVFGHIYPFWHGFRGGKGGATMLGAVAVLSPATLLAALIVWLVLAVSTGYIGLATMTAATSMPVGFALFSSPGAVASNVALGLGMASLIIWAHRENIARMRNGKENRQVNLMLFRKRSAAGRR